jgi:hypothetical protein
MRYLAAVVLALALGGTARAQGTMICTYRSEQVFGTNKICHYDCQGSPVSVSIPVLELCPVAIRR